MRGKIKIKLLIKYLVDGFHTPFFDVSHILQKGVLVIDVHERLPKIRFLVWYIFWKLSLISLVKTSKCSPLEVLKPFYDCVNTNSVKSLLIVLQNSDDVFFLQISNGWCLSNFNVWHFSYFDCWFFHFRKDISANYLIRGRQKIFHRSLFLRELIFEGHWGGWLTTDPESLLSLCSITVERNYLCRGHQNLLENAHRRVFFAYLSFHFNTKIFWVEMVKVFENIHRSQMTMLRPEGRLTYN